MTPLYKSRTIPFASCIEVSIITIHEDQTKAHSQLHGKWLQITIYLCLLSAYTHSSIPHSGWSLSGNFIIKSTASEPGTAVGLLL